MIDAGKRHRYAVGTTGLGQGTYCLDSTGQIISCDSPNIVATLPALPGGGSIPSGQSLQTSPPPVPQPPPSLWTQISRSQWVPGVPNMVLFLGVVLGVSLMSRHK